MSSVYIKQLEKSFKDGASNKVVPVLSGVSMKIDGPAIVSIVGPNGVGKTTFLRLLAGVLQPDRGTILIDGEPPPRCRIGYVPQSNPVFPWRRVEDDIAIPLEILGLSREQRRAHVLRLVKEFSFDLPLERRTQGLSGGQRQLVNLCRALVGPEPPRVLLLDEPFAALDVTARQEFLQHLQRVFTEFKPLVFLATHQLDLAVLSADMVVPFRSRPVSCWDSQVILVSIPRPRTAELRASSSFQGILATVESAFRKPSTPGGTE